MSNCQKTLQEIMFENALACFRYFQAIFTTVFELRLLK